MLFSSILKCSEEKNSSMVTILIINTLLKESSSRAGDGLPWCRHSLRRKRGLVMCQHWLQAQWLSPLGGHLRLPLGWFRRAVNTSEMDRKKKTLQETLVFNTKEPQSPSSHCCHLSLPYKPGARAAFGPWIRSKMTHVYWWGGRL